MNIFKWFVSGSDAAAKVLDAGIKGVDALVFTEEEKTEAKQKLLSQWVDLQKSMGEETTVRSVSRRIIAMLLIVPFVLLIMMSAVAFPFNEVYAKFLLELASGNFGFMAMGVAAFYFGPYMLGRDMSKK